MNTLQLTPSYWANISGGKDSWYMLNVILKNPTKYPLNGVVYFELEHEYPFINSVITLIEDRLRTVNIPVVRIKPRTKWDDLYSRYKYPTRNVRWCNSKYKLDCLKQLREFLYNNGHELYNYVGICADEVKRIREDDHIIYPLVEEGVEEKYILEWARNQSIYNDYYLYNDRCGCMYCPMQDMKNSWYNMKYYPDEFKWYMGLAEETEKEISEKTGKPISVWQGNGKYDTKYRLKRLKERGAKYEQ